MSPIFTINFRREAYLKERARARRRVLMLGVWVAYFGVIGVVLGLYGLNCLALNRRVMLIERQAARIENQQGAVSDWRVQPTELADIEGYILNPRRWRDRLRRLGEALPPNVKVTSLAVNPQNLTSPEERGKLVITGVIHPTPGQDRMQSVMRVVTLLHDDSLFAAGYTNVRLATTRVSEGSDGSAEFVIECR